MEIVERILAKIVGQEIAAEEMEAIAGGHVAGEVCLGGMYVTNSDGQSWSCDS